MSRQFLLKRATLRLIIKIYKYLRRCSSQLLEVGSLSIQIAKICIT